MAKLYTLGKGELYFAPYAPGTQDPLGFDFFGNVPSLNLSRSDERLDHYSSTAGRKVKDQSIVTQSMMTGSFTADEIRPRNLAYFVGGENVGEANTAATGQTSLFSNVIQGRFYQIGASTSRPSGVKMISNVVVTDDESSPTTFVLGTDYTVDLTTGLLSVVLGGGIDNGTNLEVTYNRAASHRVFITTNDNEIQGWLKFISFNPDGPRTDWDLPWVKLTANGDLSLIGDDWMTIPFNIEVLKRTDYPLAIAGGRPIAGTAGASEAPGGGAL